MKSTSHRLASRVYALLGTVAMSTVCIGSQFLLGDHYSSEGRAVVAARRAMQPVAMEVQPVAQPRRAKA